MNATQIAAEIARLSALLPAALDEENGWDCDVAAALTHLADARQHQGAALDRIATYAERLEGAGWETTTYETGRTANLDKVSAKNLRAAQAAAQTEQDKTAREIETGRTRHLATILSQTRGSNVLAVLGLVPTPAS